MCSQSSIANLITVTDHKLGVIDARMSANCQMSHDEASALKDAIMKLRASFKPNHPLQFAVNTIEQGFMAVLERNRGRHAPTVKSPLNSYPPSSSSSTTSIPRDDLNKQHPLSSGSEPRVRHARTTENTVGALSECQTARLSLMSWT